MSVYEFVSRDEVPPQRYTGRSHTAYSAAIEAAIAAGADGAVKLSGLTRKEAVNLGNHSNNKKSRYYRQFKAVIRVQPDGSYVVFLTAVQS